MSALNDQERYWRVEAAAELVRLPAHRVRRYIREGLIRPSRREGRIVLLGESELARLRKIRRLQEDLGLNLAGIQVTLHLLDEIETLRAVAESLRSARRIGQDGLMESS